MLIYFKHGVYINSLYYICSNFKIIKKIKQMKKLLLIAIMFAGYGVTQSFAQCGAAAAATSNTKQQCASAKASAEKSACTSQALNEEQRAMAIQVASTMDDISANVCERSGNVSFTKTSKCCTSGNEKVETVNFDPETKKFINVSPSEAAQTIQTSTEAQSSEAIRSCNRSGEAAKRCNRSASAGKACCASARKASNQ